MGCSSDVPWPSTVNVANFVTVKLCKEGDERSIKFKIWRKQMLSLLRSQDVVGFVDGEIPPPPENDDEQKVWRRADELVQGWILGSIGEDALHAVWEKPTAREIWLELEKNFKEEEEDSNNKGSGDYSRYLEVYQAAQRGDWPTANKFFKGDINELSTTIISSKLETALHIAVLTGKANEFVKKLVEMMPPDALDLKDSKGETALHYAAAVGNTAAAIALLDKNPDLLHIWNSRNRLPVHVAAGNCQRETLEYLISRHQLATRNCQRETLEYLLSKHEANQENTTFEGQHGIDLLIRVIASQYVDIALNLAHNNPRLALLRRNDKGDMSALPMLAFTPTLFPRTDALSWWQNFIYHRIPVRKSKCEVDRTSDIEKSKSKCEVARTSDIEKSNDSAAHNNYSTFVQIISRVGLQKLESAIWHVMENLVPKVKELRKKKARREQALQLAKYLCDEIVSNLPEKEASDIFHRSIMNAARYGISEIVEMIIHKAPMVAFHTDATGRNVFLMAASNRYENVMNLIYNMSDRRYMLFRSTDNQMNNLLHICGKLAPPNRLNLVAGAALQMQRELQWFKKMENFVYPSRRTWLNKEYQTPQMIFTKEHEKLKADGERWMKDTANACTIAAALIATVVFAAAFTVPGGIDSATGTPLLSGHDAFKIFVLSDAISLFTSITALLMFLSILTARYAEEDFLYVLPKRLSMGLLSLFVSITFMLLAFSATLYLLLSQRDITWFVVLIAAFACLPVASFVLLQFPLLVDVIYSTYGPGIFRKESDSLLY